MPLKTKWMPFTIETIRVLPLRQSGVYEIGKATGNIVRYIGKSDSCIRSRILTHKGETRFRGCTHFRKSQTHPDDAQLREYRLLETYRRKYGKYPPLNKIKSSGDYWKGVLY